MCGRYTLLASWHELSALFNLKKSEPLNIKARYNIAPTQHAPLIRLGKIGPKLSMVRWGLVPHWVDKPSAKYSLINARLESVTEKASFRKAFMSRRCLVPTSGWFEWHVHNNEKRPFFIYSNAKQPFAMAGIWEQWKGDEGIFDSFAILTTAADEPLCSVHPRQPVIINDPSNFEYWLNPETPKEIIFSIIQTGCMSFNKVEVGPTVNNARHDSSCCIKPLDPTSSYLAC